MEVVQAETIDLLLAPDTAEIPLMDGFRYIADVFWSKHGDMARSIFTPKDQEEKVEIYAEHRTDLIEFTKERFWNPALCPLDYIYEEAKDRALKEVWSLPIDDPLIQFIFATDFLASLRKIIDEVAIEYFKPQNRAEEFICINIMGPTSVWRTTLSPLSAFYEQPDISPEIWTDIWTQILKMHTDLGTHFATVYPGSILKALIDILTEEAYFTFHLGPDSVLKCTFTHSSLRKLTQKIETQDWWAIMKNDIRPLGIIGCPAAHVAFQPWESWIKAGVNKVGNVVRGVLYSYKK